MFQLPKYTPYDLFLCLLIDKGVLEWLLAVVRLNRGAWQRGVIIGLIETRLRTIVGRLLRKGLRATPADLRLVVGGKSLVRLILK